MSEIVTLRHNEPMTTSLAIADGTENTHESVIKLVRKYVDDLQEFGTFGFEIQKSGGRPTEIAFLNEQQATLLITYLRNSETVRRFKIALVKAFYEMRDNLNAKGGYQFITSNLSHGADLAVASERTFRSFLRAGRSAGLSLPQALRMANRQTIDRTGMDMLAEMGVEVPEANASSGVPECVARFVDDWLAGRLPVPACVCRNADLYAAYVRWCRDSALQPQSDAMFHQGVTRTGHGVQKRHVGNVHRHRVVVPPGADATVNGEKGRFYEASLARFAAALTDWS